MPLLDFRRNTYFIKATVLFKYRLQSKGAGPLPLSFKCCRLFQYSNESVQGLLGVKALTHIYIFFLHRIV